MSEKVLSILWVEDDEAIIPFGSQIMLVAAQRAQVQIRLEVVRTLAEARMRAHGFDCVLLDLGLPDSARDATAIEIKSLAAQWPPIIVLSGFVYPDDQEHQADAQQLRGLYWRVLQLGADNVFHKGVALENPHLLLDAIRKAVFKRISAQRTLHNFTKQ
jgi:CheY-like chemotaxis protein